MRSRGEWTSYAPSFARPNKGVRDIFIHHEGGGVRGVPADKPAVLRQIEAYVRSIGYSAIDYNVMVFNDGQVWAGRGVENEDAATYHNNATSVSICAVGNYEREPVSDLLIHGLRTAIREIIASGYTVGNPSIRAHKEVFSTACPGRNLIARMGDLKNWQTSLPPGPLPIHGGDVHFIKVNGKDDIAISDGINKNIYDTPAELGAGQWCAAVGGCPNTNVILVTQAYWNSLRTIKSASSGK